MSEFIQFVYRNRSEDDLSKYAHTAFSAGSIHCCCQVILWDTSTTARLVVVVKFCNPSQVRGMHQANVQLSFEHTRSEDDGEEDGFDEHIAAPVAEVVFTVEDAREMLAVRIK